MTKVGVSYRRELAGAIASSAERIDCLEVLVEHFLPLTPPRRRELEALAERFTLLPHSVSLNLGYAGPIDYEQWAAVLEVVAATDAPYVSDHGSISRAEGVDIGHLSPLWRTEEGLRTLSNRAAQVQDFFGRPLAIETITEPFVIPNADYDWDDFYVEACRRSGAGLLVDITNLFINFENGVWERKPQSFVGALSDVPWHQCHIVGYARDGDGVYHDHHDAAITPDLFDALLSATSSRRPATCIVERDGGYEQFGKVLSELEAIREQLALASD